MAQIKKLFAVETTLNAFRRFNLEAADIKQAAGKAERIVKAVEISAEVTKVELLDVKLLDE